MVHHKDLLKKINGFGHGQMLILLVDELGELPWGDTDVGVDDAVVGRVESKLVLVEIGKERVRSEHVDDLQELVVVVPAVE